MGALGGLMGLCAALDNLNINRLIFCHKPLNASNFPLVLSLQKDCMSILVRR